MLTSFITAPSGGALLAGISTYSGAMFEELLPSAYLVAGLIIGGMLIAFIFEGLRGAISDLLFHLRGGKHDN